MTINKLSFGKIFNKKEQVEAKKEEQIPSYEANEEKTAIAKLRGAAAAQYLAVLMGIAGAGAMTSCAESDVTVISDNSAITQLIEKLNSSLTDIIDLLQKFMAQVNSSDQETRALIQKLINQNTEITNILKDVSKDVKDIKTAINDIKSLIIQSNKNDEELINKINIIINGQGSDSEKLQQLIDLNKEQNEWLINISTLIGNLKGENSELSETIKMWFEQYKNDMGEFKNNDKDHTLLMQLIFKSLQESNGISKDILAAIKGIQNSNAADSAKLAQIIDLLAGIDNKLGDILAEIKNIATKLDKMIDQNEQKNDQIVDLLVDVVNNTGNIDAKMNQVIKNQEENNKLVLNINRNTDEIVAQLKNISGNMITLSQLQEMLGPMFGDVIQKLTIIDGDLISKDELAELLEQNKVNLTKTNSLIENLTEVVKNLNIGSGNISSEDLAKIAEAINDFKNLYKTNSEEQMKAYQDIIAEITKLNGGIQAIGITLSELSTNFDAFALNASTFGHAALEELARFREGQTEQTTAMENYFAKAGDYMVQAQQARNEQIALLQALVDKETGGNGGITADELREILKELGVNPNDYTALLQEISDKLGNVITSDDLQNYFIKTKPDLTKTNALIETLIDVLKNKSFSVTGDVNLNLTEIETLLSNLYNLVANGKSPSQDQINVLIQLVQKLVNAQGGEEGQSRAFRAPVNSNGMEVVNLGKNPGGNIPNIYDVYAQLAAKAAGETYNA